MALDSRRSLSVYYANVPLLVGEVPGCCLTLVSFPPRECRSDKLSRQRVSWGFPWCLWDKYPFITRSDALEAELYFTALSWEPGKLYEAWALPPAQTYAPPLAKCGSAFWQPLASPPSDAHLHYRKCARTVYRAYTGAVKFFPFSIIKSKQEMDEE